MCRNGSAATIRVFQDDVAQSIAHFSETNLQTGAITVADGKGMKAREIQLEKKGLQALKRCFVIRPSSLHDHLFLKYAGSRTGTPRR